MTEEVIKKSFWREWGILIGLAVFAVVEAGKIDKGQAPTCSQLGRNMQQQLVVS